MTAPQALSETRPRAPLVLVVDDDASIRTAMRRFLEHEGYAVLETESGRAALELVRERTDVRFVVTDLTMANGSGGWLLAQLGYEHPALLRRTLVVSGDAGSASAAHVVARWQRPILSKPFGITALVTALRQLDRDE
jgi:DNA-binding NtrC family response regulator